MGGRGRFGRGKASAEGGFSHAPAIPRHFHWHFGTVEGDSPAVCFKLQPFCQRDSVCSMHPKPKPRQEVLNVPRAVAAHGTKILF